MSAHATRPSEVAPAAAKTLRVVLAGNPNCGKTSLFNALTGAHQHVANYPGVTVERRTGSCALAELRAEVVDLPGTYSLSSFSPEEKVAEDELMGEPTVVVVVADSTQLQRNLVLLVQIMQTGANPVLCLNMSDEARAKGQTLDLPLMERLLGFPIVETVGHRGHGVAELKAAIRRAAEAPVVRHKVVLGGSWRPPWPQFAVSCPAAQLARRATAGRPRACSSMTRSTQEGWQRSPRATPRWARRAASARDSSR